MFRVRANYHYFTLTFDYFAFIKINGSASKHLALMFLIIAISNFFCDFGQHMLKLTFYFHLI